MDYEKKYKEALERAREYWETDNDNTLDIKAKGTMEYLFPELKESKDEQIRKAIIEHFASSHSSMYPYKGFTKKQFLAWLEKQGEVESDNDDIEVEEKGIRKAFNKIWEEKQDKQKSQRMISAEAKEAMYDKPADTVEQKCEESKTKIFDAPTPFEDKLYVFVAACEFLAIPSKIEFILEHSQEILDAAREQIGKEQSSTWSKEDEKEYKYVLKFVDNILNNCGNKKDYEHCKRCYDWLKSLKTKVQPKQEWSEKDEEELEIAIDTLKESGRYDSAKWVQSLKRRIGGKL